MNILICTKTIKFRHDYLYYICDETSQAELCSDYLANLGLSPSITVPITLISIEDLISIAKEKNVDGILVPSSWIFSLNPIQAEIAIQKILATGMKFLAGLSDPKLEVNHSDVSVIRLVGDNGFSVLAKAANADPYPRARKAFLESVYIKLSKAKLRRIPSSVRKNV